MDTAGGVRRWAGWPLALVTVLAIAGAVLLASQLRADPQTSSPPRDWTLEAFRIHGRLWEPFPGHPVSLTLGEAGVSGMIVCNTYAMGMKIDPSARTIEMAGIQTTRLACGDDEHDFEVDYVVALASVRRFDVVDGRLRLAGDGVELRFLPRDGS